MTSDLASPPASSADFLSVRSNLYNQRSQVTLERGLVRSACVDRNASHKPT